MLRNKTTNCHTLSTGTVKRPVDCNTLRTRPQVYGVNACVVVGRNPQPIRAVIHLPHLTTIRQAVSPLPGTAHLIACIHDDRVVAERFSRHRRQIVRGALAPAVGDAEKACASRSTSDRVEDEAIGSGYLNEPDSNQDPLRGVVFDRGVGNYPPGSASTSDIDSAY